MSPAPPSSSTAQSRAANAITRDGRTASAWSGEPDSLAVFVLVIWLGCLVIGWLGFQLPYARPHPPASPELPVLAKRLEVDLTDVPTPPEVMPPPPDPLAPPPPPDALVPPPIAQPIAVAQPIPAVAFPVPVEGPVRIVEAKQAGHVAPATNRPATLSPSMAAPPAVQQLTFGEGEGKQPAPEYPPAAVRRGQEGVVLVRFSVSAEGRVLAAESIVPSPWPLLNESAVRAVREKWRFRAGPARLYEVAIRFELTK